jgi:hypothetical protein
MRPKPYTGRPKKNDESKFYDGALYKLLVSKMPSEFIKYGRLDTLKLADRLNVHRYTVYCWLNGRRPSRDGMKSLLDISQATEETEKKGALTKEDLIPFLLGN